MNKQAILIIVVAIVVALGAWMFISNSALLPSLPKVDNDTVAAKCYVGGCSSQICSDQPDIVSTCEFREEYACYQGATCERQQDGNCGWTETESLRMCLSAALSL